MDKRKITDLEAIVGNYGEKINIVPSETIIDLANKGDISLTAYLLYSNIITRYIREESTSINAMSGVMGINADDLMQFYKELADKDIISYTLPK